ncbi:hypothetical protein [Tenacibaculum jejuense]|uniref:Uncharacterized protein n=1 Tax=Tenacibaculum jejuense TaxID=584609 RepID=A0A238UAP4_9FLAO|nr:hypothetical protein [Tenacibaculum jejuense]SNR16239.1 Protein of unknown function [Tenacibaculum jejuense]
MEIFKDLKNQKVERLYLVVWPPLGEEKELDIDISFGLVLYKYSDHLTIITTDKEDMWTPRIQTQKIPLKVYSWSSFRSRMDAWINLECEDDLETEYYEVTNVSEFSTIVNSRIESLELIGVKNNPEPFGVKVKFKNDYILSTPISDGNTIETSLFNKNNNLSNFESLGSIESKVIY